MLSTLVLNAHQLHEFATRVLQKSRGTLEFKGPWFAKMDFIITSDPMNVQYISSKNFSNYPKGPDLRMILEPFGDGVFAADGNLWKMQRKMIHSVMKHNKFESALEKTIYQKLENGLIPVLDHASEVGIKVDLQDVFQRFTFDNICMSVLGIDPNYLSFEFPQVAYANAFNATEQAVFIATLCQRVGGSCKNGKASTEEEFDVLTAFMVEGEEEEEMNEDREIGALRRNDTFLRDTAFNLLAAGKETVSSGLVWFFWLVATHPSVENKILEEMKANMVMQKEEEEEHRDKRLLFDAKEVNRMVYLHAALCETLRLYPPVPYNHKIAAQADVLPSGHRINKNHSILISYYAMGRMEEIWGKDCLEFKPQRWISERGSIVHVPSYKFTAFHAGPRNCLGKDTAFIQMKMVAALILGNYQVKIVQGHPVSPCNSMVLHMKYGLKVQLSKRTIW
ncbi:cytochrome P450 family 96 subfamily A polypeptide 1 [Citrus sinensis]|nr:cytochrome P450 family 96 subfamily A polypeptide 1 [Citrus sinensis]